MSTMTTENLTQQHDCCDHAERRGNEWVCPIDGTTWEAMGA